MQGVYRTEGERKKKTKREKAKSTATPSLKSLRLLPCLVKRTREARLKRSFAALAESLRGQGGERGKKVDWCVCLDLKLHQKHASSLRSVLFCLFLSEGIV